MTQQCINITHYSKREEEQPRSRGEIKPGLDSDKNHGHVRGGYRRDISTLARVALKPGLWNQSPSTFKWWGGETLGSDSTDVVCGANALYANNTLAFLFFWSKSSWSRSQNISVPGARNLSSGSTALVWTSAEKQDTTLGLPTNKGWSLTFGRACVGGLWWVHRSWRQRWWTGRWSLTRRWRQRRSSAPTTLVT